MNSDSPDVNGLMHVLASDPLISQYEILLYEYTPAKFQLKLRIEFVDSSTLFTNDCVGATKRKYAFHWQKNEASWLMRWDNAPHFPKLASFPHHKHDYRSGSELVTDSYDISLVDVLRYISNQLTHQIS